MSTPGDQPQRGLWTRIAATISRWPSLQRCRVRHAPAAGRQHLECPAEICAELPARLRGQHRGHRVAELGVAQVDGVRPRAGWQAVDALRRQVPACIHCRPDTALGILD
ncbi:DUF6233 domain-containing protein [Streptomyces sp. NPDC046915]|uniref:DUF6233 domain-containing protein n=1 Tax=Streptomyces sp. NPDC046915 TaxID=3155257 RepID=UPI0033F9327B